MKFYCIVLGHKKPLVDFLTYMFQIAFYYTQFSVLYLPLGSSNLPKSKTLLAGVIISVPSSFLNEFEKFEYNLLKYDFEIHSFPGNKKIFVLNIIEIVLFLFIGKYCNIEIKTLSLAIEQYLIGFWNLLGNLGNMKKLRRIFVFPPIDDKKSDYSSLAE